MRVLVRDRGRGPLSVVARDATCGVCLLPFHVLMLHVVCACPLVRGVHDNA
jgi:hypothetical protein